MKKDKFDRHIKNEFNTAKEREMARLDGFAEAFSADLRGDNPDLSNLGKISPPKHGMNR